VTASDTGLFMIENVDMEKSTILLADYICDKKIIHHASRDELEVYSSAFHNAGQINLFLSVEYNEKEQMILKS